MDYLKDLQYYEDLYDLLTIKQCLDVENQPPPQDLPKFYGKKISPEQAKGIGKSVNGFLLYFIKGDRYKQRSERIKEWTLRDRGRQEFFDRTSPPTGIYCSNCGEVMKSKVKTLEDDFEGHMRVLFFFECPACHKRKGVYNNSEPFVGRIDPCPKCHLKLEISYKRDGEVITTFRKCRSCGFSDTEEEDLHKENADWEERQKSERKMLAEYREKYCLSEKEGLEFTRFTILMKNFTEMTEANKKKQEDPAYHKAMKLKKLTVVELEKMLARKLAWSKYSKLIFDKPEIGKQVIVPFTVRDSDTTRKEYDSANLLKKLLKKALSPTNWRLMSEGVTYRLGYIYGRLKGYEREEELMELVRS
jgi:hypothetical protein